MIYTSYFAKFKKLPENMIPISICGKAPTGYTGLQYKKLAPKYKFFMEWKENHDNEFYITNFKKQVLDSLTINGVLNDLYDLLSPEQKEKLNKEENWNNKDTHIVLLCYEKPSDFCHRHLVADWMTEAGIHVEEYTC